MAKILVVEDDADLREILTFRLVGSGHTVHPVESGKEALPALRVNKYDLIILDWMMPEVDGMDVLKEFRELGGQTPVLMLTAKSWVDDKERALDSGADDYLTKPFDFKELMARVRALLRRPSGTVANVVHTAGIELDPVSCRVTKGGVEVHLRPKVYAILEFLMRHPNQLFTAEALLTRIWLDDSLATVDTIRTHMKLLRRSLELKEGELIRTVRHKGYMLVDE